MLTLSTASDSFAQISDGGRAAVQFNFTVTEDDPLLTNQLLEGTVDWDDGTGEEPLSPSPVVLFPTGTTTFIKTHTFAPGTYYIGVSTHNFRSPKNDITEQIVPLVVQGNAPPPAQTIAFRGPILPRDYGFPNAQQWNLDSADDLRILESSIKMLLITGVGERIMQPDYGTRLQRVIFEPNDDIVQNLVQTEIIQAVTQWEPRVSLLKMQIVRDPNLRKADVNLIFLSKLSNQPFQVDLAFAR